MMTLITGGAKCGKSKLAEKLLDSFMGNKIYMAAMLPYGDEAEAAIKRHRKLRKGKGFSTIEKYTDIEQTELPENCAVLLECMANLCANEMFREDKRHDVFSHIMCGIEKLHKCSEQLVIVTNEVGCDGIAYPAETAEYIRILSRINAAIAADADNVVECVYGIPVMLKGEICC